MSYQQVTDLSNLYVQRNSLASALESGGLVLSGVPVEDGEIHRVSTREDRPGNKSGWYVSHGNVAVFGDFRQGWQEKWFASGISTVDRSRLSEQAEAARQKRLEAQAEEQRRVASSARRLWDESTSPSEHPYLESKRIHGHGIRRQGDALVVPLWDASGEIQNIQRIYPDGQKRFMRGGKKKGLHFQLGDELTEVTYLCEGYATAAAIHKATGRSAIVAFDAGNLIPVARQLAKQDSSVTFVTASDADIWTKNNPGRSQGERAAGILNGPLAIPKFEPKDLKDGKVTDFHDLYVVRGVDEVKRQLEAAEFVWPTPEPLPQGRPAVDVFDFDLLPEALRDYVKDCAERIGCPPDFIAVGVVCALGSVAGRKLGIRPKQHDDWLVVPNLWGAIVGSPSSMKTPAFNAGLRALQLLEDSAADACAGEANHALAAKKAHEAMLKDIQQKMQKATSKGNHREIADLKEEYAAELNDYEEFSPRRYSTNDATVEKLGELLNQNPNGLLVKRDELVGFMRSLDKTGREGDRSFYLESWNGTGTYQTDRIGRGTISIKSNTVSVFGTIQPGPLSGYVRGASDGGIQSDGLLQRFQLMVWPDTPKSLGVDRQPNSEAFQQLIRVFQVVDEMPTHPDADIPFIRFSGDAQAVFNQWREEIEDRARKAEHEALEAHLAKYRSLMPSLALLFQLAEGDTSAVSKTNAARAADWCDYLESHARRVYSQVLHSDEIAAGLLAQRILSGALGPEFSPRDAYRKHWQGLGQADVSAALPVLQECGWIKVEQVGGVGRAKTVVTVNPSVIQEVSRAA